MARPSRISESITEVNPETNERREIRLVDAIVRAVEAGASLELACESVGLAVATAYGWRARGEEHADPGVYASGKKKGEPKPIPEAEEPYVEFLELLTRARGRGRVWHIANIKKAAAEDWRASAFFLERSDPENWARRDKTQVSGNVGFTQSSVDLSNLTDEEVERLEGLLAKAEDKD